MVHGQEEGIAFMDQTTPTPKIVNKIVVKFDICSSTKIMEQLLARDEIGAWCGLLNSLEELLNERLKALNGDLYKFTGDGWIMLFDGAGGIEGLMEVVKKLSERYESLYNERIMNKIDDPYGSTAGLTFGIDHGRLVKLTMGSKNEYVGRPINMACRLQSAVDERDFKAGYRILLSNVTYCAFSKSLRKYHPDSARKSLKNVFGGTDLTCFRLIVLDPPFRIVSARYGHGEYWRDVTEKCIEMTKDNRLEMRASNDELGDPVKGEKKDLIIEYRVRGERFENKFKEDVWVSLPEQS